MKKPIYSLLILIMLVLSACAGQAPVAQSGNRQSNDQLISFNKSAASSSSSILSGAGINTDFENAESVMTQMILGLIKLDGTDLALTKAQAASLLPLWDAYQTAMQKSMPAGGPQGGQPGEAGKASGTPAAPAAPPATPAAGATPAAPAENTELQAFATNMQAVLTTEQINAINEMKITRDIATTIIKEKGISNGGPDQQSGTTSSTQQPPAGGQGQQPPAGGQGQQPPADGQQMPTKNATGRSGNQPGQPPTDGPGRGSGMVQPGLIKAFTELLEKVSGTKSTVAFIPAGLNPAGALPGDQGGPGGQGGLDETSSTVIYGAVYRQKGGNESKTDQIINSTEKDQSAVLVTDSGTLNLSKSKITTSGNTSSQDSSSFVGLNAGVLATSGASINLTDSTITTTGEGANGAFATGTGSTVNLTNVVIDATADGGHGVMTTKGGVITLKDVDITTRGGSSGALATDRGSGTVTADGGTVTTYGNNSPAIYSTGIISVNNGILSSTGAESAVIEGANTITLNNSILTSSKEDKWGVMIYQSMSGDAEGTRGTFAMTGGELSNTAKKGPLFFITNSTGVISLTGVAVTANSGELINASVNRWGNEGSNGGTVIFTADEQNLSGSITADMLSSVELNLQNGSTLKSSINPTNTARAIKLKLDATSSWNVIANSYISTLSDPDGISGTTITNIKGNGFTVFYNSASSPELGGMTYTLDEGGTLTPVS